MLPGLQKKTGRGLRMLLRLSPANVPLCPHLLAAADAVMQVVLAALAKHAARSRGSCAWPQIYQVCSTDTPAGAIGACARSHCHSAAGCVAAALGWCVPHAAPAAAHAPLARPACCSLFLVPQRGLHHASPADATMMFDGLRHFMAKRGWCAMSLHTGALGDPTTVRRLAACAPLVTCSC